MTRGQRIVLFAPLALLGIAAFIFVGGFIVQSLWNWLVPALFGWRAITFWQALGILVLCRILFGGFGFRGSGHRRGMRGRMAERMGERMAERWERMTPEEREAFRRGMAGRCDFGSAAGDRPAATDRPGQ